MGRVPKQSKPIGANGRRNFITPRTREEIENWHEQKVRFSFRYFDIDNEAFNCGGTDAGWFVHFLENIKSVSDMSKNEFVVTNRQHFEVHPHDWSELKYKFDTLPQDLMEQVESECLQFTLSKSKGRVHGFWILETF